MTLSKEAFEQWCWRLGLSDQAKAVITQIRTSPPARHVQSAAGNVSGTYPSQKMGCSIQFESHRDELPFVYLTEHDPQVRCPDAAGSLDEDDRLLAKGGHASTRAGYHELSSPPGDPRLPRIEEHAMR